MSKEILIVDLSVINASVSNRVPVISKIRYFQQSGARLTLITTPSGRELYASQLNEVTYWEVTTEREVSNRLLLIFEYLVRNISSLKYLFKARNKFEVVYSLSAVLDFLIFPYLLTLVSKRTKWCVVFDNKVSLREGSRSIARILSFLFYLVSLPLLKRAHIIYPISVSLQEYLVGVGFSRSRLRVTGNAVEDDLIKNAKKDKDLKTDSIYVGRLHEDKGVFDLIKVASLVKEQVPDFRMGLMGMGDKESEKRIKSLISKLDLKDNVELMGFVSGEQKYNLIKSASTFLSLSYYESFNVALLEAVVSGVYCIAYDLEVYHTLYQKNEVNLVPVGDIKGVAQLVLSAITVEPQLNKNGMQLLNRYSWTGIAKIEWESFCDSL